MSGSPIIRSYRATDVLFSVPGPALLRSFYVVLSSMLMAAENFKVREILLMVTGWAATLMVIMSCTGLYARKYREGALLLVVAAALAFVFFRRRKLVLILSGLSWVLVNAGITFPFHPSLLGLALTIGSAAGIYLTVRWTYKRYPYLSFKHIHAAFDGEAAMAAENARIEAESRELVKRRPYGPWLFR